MHEWICQNKLTSAIVIYVILFYSLQLCKPTWLYKADGSLREFGVGFRQKTFVPMWLCSVLLGIFSYIGVMYMCLW